MNKPAIVVVTGPPGVGKNTWIQQQLARVRASLLYFNPGTGTVPIDQTYIATAFPGVQILPGETESQFLQLLASEVLNLASLEAFWYELTQGPYGQVTRAKGIFDIADGQSLYGDFVLNVLARDFAPLNLPRWLEGRPQRFSGMEVVGQNLDEEAIAQTLQDCCLSEAAIRYYQQQVIESLKFSEAESL